MKLEQEELTSSTERHQGKTPLEEVSRRSQNNNSKPQARREPTRQWGQHRLPWPGCDDLTGQRVDHQEYRSVHGMESGLRGLRAQSGQIRLHSSSCCVLGYRMQVKNLEVVIAGSLLEVQLGGTGS